MNNDIKKQIATAAEVHAQEQIAVASRCCEQCEMKARDCFVDRHGYGQRSFTAGAEFGFGLLRQQLAKDAQDSLSYQWDLRKECDALAAKLQQEQQWSGEREDVLAKQVDALAARVQQLENSLADANDCHNTTAESHLKYIAKLEAEQVTISARLAEAEAAVIHYRDKANRLADRVANIEENK